MKIGFYIHHTTIKAGGIFTYSSGILKLLLNSDKIEKICLIYSSEIKSEISALLQNPKIEILEIDRRKLGIKIPLMLSYFLYDSYLIIKNYYPNSKRIDFLRGLSFRINPYRSRINKKDISLLHVPLQYSPVYSLNIPIVITMHDLQEFHFPEFFSSQERLHRAINNKKALEECSHIIVSFEHIKKDILKFFGIEEYKISICPPPFAENWFTQNEFSDFDDIKNKYSLHDEFILYPAASWQHKNHLNLIRAIHLLRLKGLKVNLICTGNKTEYFDRVLKSKINELNLSNAIRFLGIIPEKDLISLYKMTKLVVIPTLYESGSGPLYEAMRYEVPVICSNVTSLPETMHDNEFIFDPQKPEQIAEIIGKGLRDEKFRKKNLNNSKTRCTEFKGKNFSDNFILAYKRTLKNKHGL